MKYMNLRKPLFLMTLLLSLNFCAGCLFQSDPVVLVESESVFVVKNGELLQIKDGKVLSKTTLAEKEKWYLIAPGTLVKLYKQVKAAQVKSAEDEIKRKAANVGNVSEDGDP